MSLQAAPLAIRPWLIVTALLIVGALVAWWLPTAWLDWQPDQATAQPWRAWTAVWVHWSPLHLGTNLMAAAVVGAYGWAAQVPRAQALAWCAAWPLTHAALLIKPDLAHYGGLSGVLHAGVALVCLWLVLRTRGARRVVGVMVSVGLIIKLASEQPWGPAMQTSQEWDISIAPIAHSTGALAGLLCGALALWLSKVSAK